MAQIRLRFDYRLNENQEVVWKHWKRGNKQVAVMWRPNSSTPFVCNVRADEYRNLKDQLRKMMLNDWEFDTIEFSLFNSIPKSMIGEEWAKMHSSIFSIDTSNSDES